MEGRYILAGHVTPPCNEPSTRSFRKQVSMHRNLSRPWSLRSSLYQNPLISAHRLISGPLHPLITTCFVVRLITTFAFLRPLMSVMYSSISSALRTAFANSVKSPCILRMVVMCFDPPDLVDW